MQIKNLKLNKMVDAWQNFCICIKKEGEIPLLIHNCLHVRMAIKIGNKGRPSFGKEHYKGKSLVTTLDTHKF